MIDALAELFALPDISNHIRSETEFVIHAIQKWSKNWTLKRCTSRQAAFGRTPTHHLLRDEFLALQAFDSLTLRGDSQLRGRTITTSIAFIAPCGKSPRPVRHSLHRFPFGESFSDASASSLWPQ